jgi:DNA anti-recombination protein RmuC
MMSHMLATSDEPSYILEDQVTSEAVNFHTKVNGKGKSTFSRSSVGALGKVLFAVDSKASLRASQRLIEDATETGILEL